MPKLQSYALSVALTKMKHSVITAKSGQKCLVLPINDNYLTLIEKDGKEQLKSYCNATGAPIGIWSNGDSISYYHRKDPNYFEDIPNIPRADQKLSDILEERWTIEDLIAKGKEEINKYLKLHEDKKVSLSTEQITKLTGELKTE